MGGRGSICAVGFRMFEGFCLTVVTTMLSFRVTWLSVLSEHLGSGPGEGGHRMRGSSLHKQDVLIIWDGLSFPFSVLGFCA